MDDALARALECRSHPDVSKYPSSQSAEFEMHFAVMPEAAVARWLKPCRGIQSRARVRPTISRVRQRVSLGWARARLGQREAGMRRNCAKGLAATYGTGKQGMDAAITKASSPRLEAEGRDIGRSLACGSTKLWRWRARLGEHWSGRFSSPHPWRNLIEARSGEHGAGRGMLSSPPSQSQQQQKARSFELQAALSLAKLYQSTGRPADAHAVLAPALEGFSPTLGIPGDS